MPQSRRVHCPLFHSSSPTRWSTAIQHTSKLDLYEAMLKKVLDTLDANPAAEGGDGGLHHLR